MIHVFNYKDKNYIYDVGSGSLHECDKATADYLKTILREGDHVLFKASRSMALETVVEALTAGTNS